MLTPRRTLAFVAIGALMTQLGSMGTTEPIEETVQAIAETTERATATEEAEAENKTRDLKERRKLLFQKGETTQMLKEIKKLLKVLPEHQNVPGLRRMNYRKLKDLYQVLRTEAAKNQQHATPQTKTGLPQTNTGLAQTTSDPSESAQRWTKEAAAEMNMNSRSVIEKFQRSDGHRVIFFSRIMKTGSSSVLSALGDLKPGKDQCYRQDIHVEPAFGQNALRGGGRGGGRCTASHGVGCIFKSSSRPELADWKDIFAAGNEFNDLWITSHHLNFDRAQNIAKAYIPAGIQINYVTIIRSPFDWIRSLYAHGHRNTGSGRFAENITEWVATAGLSYMGEVYPMALPNEMQMPFRSWLNHFVVKRRNRATIPTEELFPVPPNDAVKEFVKNVNFMAAGRHLREHYLILLTEYHSLSTSLLSVALCGHNSSLREKHLLRQQNSKYAAFERYSFRSETLNALSPILAPLEMLYSVYSTIFFEDVARYL